MAEYYKTKNMFENNRPVDETGNEYANLNEGIEVVYMGNVLGGPSIGSAGKIMKIYARKALVDMGALGTWNVPYCFLAATAA
tara:strand:+ start:454 stop:699 length:246 start_codon:yes stop_codon:yes gene_type:complete